MGAEFNPSDLIRVFVSEASDGTRVLAEALRANGELPPPPHELYEHYIVAHRLRGAAALYGYGGVSQLSAELELILERANDIAPDDWPTVVRVMREVVGGLVVLIKGIGQDGSEDATVVTRCLGLLDELQVLPPAVSVSLDYVHPAIDVEILSYFTPEAGEYLQTIDELVRILRSTRDHDDAIYRLFRATHTLKGSAYTVGFQVIGDIARPMEDGMIAVREKRLVLTDHMLETFEQATRTVQLLLRRDPQGGYQLQRDVPVLIHRLIQICEGGGSAGSMSGGPTGSDVLPTSHVRAEPVFSVEVPPPDLSDAWLLP